MSEYVCVRVHACICVCLYMCVHGLSPQFSNGPEGAPPLNLAFGPNKLIHLALIRLFLCLYSREFPLEDIVRIDPDQFKLNLAEWRVSSLSHFRFVVIYV